MRTPIAVFTALLLVPASLLFSGFDSWKQPAGSPTVEPFQSVLPNPADPEKVLLATPHDIYERKISSRDWDRKWSQPFTRIQKLEMFDGLKDSLFALTEKGLYQIYLENWRWSKINSGGNSKEKTIQAMAVLPEDSNHWFLGTQSGLFESDDAGKSWNKFTDFSRKKICALTVSSHQLLVATEKDIYISKDLSHFSKAFSLPFTSEPAPENSTADGGVLVENEEVPAASECSIREAVFAESGRNLWIATSQGIFQSRDEALSWQKISSLGLGSRSVEHLVYNSKTDHLFASSGNLVFVFDGPVQKWQQLSLNLDDSPLKELGVSIIDSKERLLAVTQYGFYHYPLPDHLSFEERNIAPNREVLFSELIRLEPTAQEVAQAAVHYNNVRNSKINRWQKLSRLSAFLPHVSFGRDFSRDNNIDIDRGGTNTADEFIAGPDDISKNWNLDVGWTLSDFIWSSNQTSIDSREKLMLELRNDILTEITRLYFERRRLQMEAALDCAASKKDHLEKILRIEELTALLDGMTGNFISTRLALIYSDHPEIQDLWAFEEKALVSNSLLANPA